jgi:hypothetical protein
MEITKDNFVSARFCDNDRTQIEVFVKGDKENEVFPHIIELDENHPDYKNLKSIVSLPEIHEYTDRWCTEQRRRFKEEMIDIAKKEGIIKVSKSNVKEVEVKVENTLEELISKIFVEKIDYNNDDIKEQMFKAKLAAFELPHVKDSDNRELKAKLRKAETFRDIVSITSSF